MRFKFSMSFFGKEVVDVELRIGIDNPPQQIPR